MVQKTLNSELLSDSSIFRNFNRIIPKEIVNNLNPKFKLRKYQKEAITRFIFYISDFNAAVKSPHLLFNMATGSGKTLIMAACILNMYTREYRDFLFFVNRDNIVNKTRDNFLNPHSSKYLFANKIIIDEKEIKIREVENFQDSNKNDINIHFTTIQGLHEHLNNPRENSVTFEDFEEKKILFLSDEAHHINALTKSISQKTKEDKLNESTWENTVNQIFKSSSDNLMLEFTATIELDHINVYNKYKDKILYQYSLKQFRIDKYSKEIKIFQSPLQNIDRALQAVILSQYRLKVAEKHGLQIKPVILMKSKKIEDSVNFENEFNSLIRNLTPKQLQDIKTKTNISIFNRAFNYFHRNKITMDNLVREIQEDFSSIKCLSINSKNQSEEKQLLVNRLEDLDNLIRVIFAVDKLNEGWDVLNLFDIVRLYKTRDAKGGKPGRTTVSEAQLIGRGARYCPFRLEPHQKLYKRKYDEAINNELRILEELYYHSVRNPKYIQELRTVLIQIGIIPKENVTKDLTVKNKIKKEEIWKTGKLFLNTRIENDRSHIKGFFDLDITKKHQETLKIGLSSIMTPFESKKESKSIKTSKKEYKLVDFGEIILRKALNKLHTFEFSILKKFFPHLKSISEFINSEHFLGSIKVEVKAAGQQKLVDYLNPNQKLEIAISVLSKISEEIKLGSINFGTKIFQHKKISDVFTDKKLNFNITKDSHKEFGIGMSETKNSDLYMDLTTRDWFVFKEIYGTDQEKYMVRFFDSIMEQLQKNFKKIYLFRNAKHFQVYNFSNGKAFEPDFIIFLEEKKAQNPKVYQIFLEPKGSHLVEKDKWKEDFLMQIEGEYELETGFDKKKIIVSGMPFYNEDKRLKKKFITSFFTLLGI